MFALFVDVMGVQAQLVGDKADSEPEGQFARCQERLEDFHGDLRNTIERDLPLLLLSDTSVPEPNFVAEFSDSAFVVGPRFASVAIAGVLLMRKALRHEYPLRGGIGFGSFSHEDSGVRAKRDGQVWSTSSFLGGSVVTAYQAERSRARGLRVFIHPAVMRLVSEGLRDVFSAPLSACELTPEATHELRQWHGTDSVLARERLDAFRAKQELTPRALEHYDATTAAFDRLAGIEAPIPLAPPAIWL
jgi:hypothetical protein